MHYCVLGKFEKHAEDSAEVIESKPSIVQLSEHVRADEIIALPEETHGVGEEEVERRVDHTLVRWRHWHCIALWSLEGEI